MKKNKVLCLYPASEAVRAALHEAAPGAEIVFASRDSVTLEDLVSSGKTLNFSI